ncbi:MAG: hypothetical protein R2682_07520 [Pyrinomonadaceae bacterium]
MHHFDYGSVVLNARADSLGKTALVPAAHLPRRQADRFTGQPQSVAQGQQPADSVAFMGSINLGTKLEARRLRYGGRGHRHARKGKYATAVSMWNSAS